MTISVSPQYHSSHIHKQMNRKELSRYFGVESHDEGKTKSRKYQRGLIHLVVDLK